MRPWIALLALFIMGTANAFDSIRLNIGGEEYTDSNGEVWSASDLSAWTGSARTATHVHDIANTEADVLFHTSVWDGSKWVTDGTAADPSLNITVPNGEYFIDFYNLEQHAPNFKVGGRVFDIKVEGETAITAWDIWAEAGGEFIAQKKTIETTVADGELNIVLTNPVANAGTISAVHVYEKLKTPVEVDVDGILLLSKNEGLDKLFDPLVSQAIANANVATGGYAEVVKQMEGVSTDDLRRLANAAQSLRNTGMNLGFVLGLKQGGYACVTGIDEANKITTDGAAPPVEVTPVAPQADPAAIPSTGAAQ